MTVKMNSVISEYCFQISENEQNNSEIAEFFFYQSMLHLLGNDRLEDSLRALFQFLRERLPVAYIFFNPPYENHTYKHIYIDNSGTHFYNNELSITNKTVHDIFNQRQIHKHNKINYYEKSEYIDEIFFEITKNRKTYVPCLYLYFIYNKKIQGSIWIGCAEGKKFTERDIKLLSLLWDPLFFITRFYYQQYKMEKILELTRENNKSLKAQVSGFSDIIGVNSGLREVAREIRLIAPFDISVLLTGETGTGKDIFASELHRLSPRRDKPFIVVNCGGITSTLIDSELFGYDKGAFTGAIKDYKGRFERTNGGTIFLDEIGELPLDEQARLLRVIQNRTVERLGGSTTIPVDFRLICATNKDLPAMVREGRFREDLYFRLAGMTVKIPPLRERIGDIPLLAQHVINNNSVRYGVLPPLIEEEEMKKLLEYSWPGNVRELINVVTEAFVRSLVDGRVVFRMSRSSGETPTSILGGSEFCKSYDEMRREYFMDLLARCEGRISGDRGAAELAKLKPNTLRSKLDKLGISYGRRYSFPE